MLPNGILRIIMCINTFIKFRVIHLGFFYLLFMIALIFKYIASPSKEFYMQIKSRFKNWYDMIFLGLNRFKPLYCILRVVSMVFDFYNTPWCFNYVKSAIMVNTHLSCFGYYALNSVELVPRTMLLWFLFIIVRSDK